MHKLLKQQSLQRIETIISSHNYNVTLRIEVVNLQTFPRFCVVQLDPFQKHFSAAVF